MTDNDRLNLLLDLRRYADAEKAAREAIARNPDWGAGYTHLARALVNLNKKDEAIAAAREGVRKAPRDAWAVSTLACALNWFGRSKEALEPAEEAIRLDPRYPWAYAMLANILFNLDRFQDALARSVEGLRHDPKYESLFRWKGWAEHKLGRHADALATADAGIKLHPNSHLLLNLIGCVKWTLAEKAWGPERLRLHREAEAKIRDAVRLDPSQPAYRDNLRGNAVSCRRHVVALVFPALAFLLVFVPIGTFCQAVLRHKHATASALLAGGTLLLVLLLAAAFPGSFAAQSLPLARWNVPDVQLTEKDRRTAKAELFAVGLLLVLPYLLAIVAATG